MKRISRHANSQNRTRSQAQDVIRPEDIVRAEATQAYGAAYVKYGRRDHPMSYLLAYTKKRRNLNRAYQAYTTLFTRLQARNDQGGAHLLNARYELLIAIINQTYAADCAAVIQAG